MKLLKLRPYETTEIHSILYSIWFLESGFNGLLDSEMALCSDKLCFRGYVHNQNNKHRCIENPHVLHKVLLNDLKVWMCCAISARGIIRPVCWRNNKFRTLCAIYCHPSSINGLMIKYHRPTGILCKIMQQHILESFMHALGIAFSRDSSVGIATGYWLDDRGIRVRVLVKNFLFAASRLALEPTQPIQWVSGVLSQGAKRSGREGDNSPPTSAEVKKTWIYTSTPPYVFMT
jgi:hypothetical protein